MAQKRSGARNTRRERAVFESIRKPLAPPGHPMSESKPTEKARPAGRKAKHKRQPEREVEEES